MPESKAHGKAAAKAAEASEEKPIIGEEERLSLQRAFKTFQRQSMLLEKSHADLRQRLERAQLDLAEKNRQLASGLKELAAMKERLSAILESISDAVLILRPDGTLETANEAAKNFILACGIDVAQSLRDAISKASKSEDGLIEMQTPEGRRRYMLSALVMKGSAAAGELVVSLKDVTELMELQERVGRESRLMALGRVAASVAHEIRNPLGAIEGFGMLLERDLKDSPQLLRLASKTVYAARQLNSVVSNLLSYTRELRVELAPCDAAALAEEALEFVKPMADDRKTRIEIEKPESGKPLIALVDQRQFKQVLVNLMMNAMDACPHRGGGLVKIACKRQSGPLKARIEVIDNGTGVPASLKKRIFEPFFTTKDGGTGLGLSLCQRIVEAHGGAISEDGAEGQGARFIIELKSADASGATV